MKAGRSHGMLVGYFTVFIHCINSSDSTPCDSGFPINDLLEETSRYTSVDIVTINTP
ncbi:hypothetical protein WN55_07892 [Dufourea novaeangliae]|uniref:Uncharacterized protein n=1 Tax=Dufourea novaeangliae TaxID=178035 RepID=A0A154NW35_DUFNO|nr:hypothetical protein WN55_07892 [Dufourea novaeangliae]